MTFLFIATIGPVQPFIAGARRTRDLYVGSTLLSELSKAAANAIFQEVKKEQGVSQLIFPAISLSDEALLAPETALNVANKIVAIIQNSPHDTGEKIREAIKVRLETVKMGAMGTITLSNQEKADAQIANLVEYFWVAVPLEDVNEYKNARKRAEALLSARKNTQFFNAVSWGGSEAKSSIDGQRECVIPEGYYPDRRNDGKAKVKAKTEQLYKAYNAGPHERLSAVDLLKRRGLKSMHEIVHSTSHIAAAPFLEHLENPENLGISERQEAKRLWNNYIDKVGTLAPSSIVEYVAEKLKYPHPVTGNVDGALLFKERLLDETKYPDELKFVDEALAKFFSFTDSHLDGLRPSPYYVILLADGDGMGQAIDQQAERGPQGHQEISQALAGFANNVRDIVDTKHRGSLVYAGGDDVLALLPLHTALACARDLHEAFGSALREFQGKNGKIPTLSVGLVVVHHISLLLDALELARKAEHKAKGHPEKDALAVIVKKRGGEPNEIVVPWNDEEERLSLLVALYNADIIPDGMAYELRTMLERLSVSFKQNKPETEKEKAEQKKLQGIIQLEAARILRRKLYFSRERIKQPDYQDIEQLLTKHLEPIEITETIKVPKTPHDLARYLLLRQIHVKEHPKDGFEISEPADITAFVDALIVAQTFAEALKPTATKGFVE